MMQEKIDIANQVREILLNKLQTTEQKIGSLIELLSDVRILDLSSKLSNVKDLTPLLRALESHQTIKRLSLNFNYLSGQRLIDVLQSLKKNHSIERLELKYNGICEQDSLIIKEFLNFNSSMVHLYLDESFERGDHEETKSRSNQNNKKISKKEIKIFDKILEKKLEERKAKLTQLIIKTDAIIEFITNRSVTRSVKKAQESPEKTISEILEFVQYWQPESYHLEKLEELVYKTAQALSLLNRTDEAITLLHKFLQKDESICAQEEKKYTARLAPEFFNIILPKEEDDIQFAKQYILEQWPTLQRCLCNLDNENRNEWSQKFYNLFAGGEPSKDIVFLTMNRLKEILNNTSKLYWLINALEKIVSEYAISFCGQATKEQLDFLQYYRELKEAVEKNNLEALYNLYVDLSGKNPVLFKRICNQPEQIQIFIIETLPIIFKKILNEQKIEQNKDKNQEIQEKNKTASSFIDKGLFKKRPGDTDEGERKKKKPNEPAPEPGN